MPKDVGTDRLVFGSRGKPRNQKLALGPALGAVELTPTLQQVCPELIALALARRDTPQAWSRLISSTTLRLHRSHAHVNLEKKGLVVSVWVPS